MDEDYESLEAEWMREYLVEIDAVGERESDAINQNLENKKEEDMREIAEARELTREYLATIAEAREYLATIAERRRT